MGRKKRTDHGLIPEHIHYFFKYGSEYLYHFEKWADLPWAIDFFILHGRWLKTPWVVRKFWAELKAGLLKGVDVSSWWAENHILELQPADQHRQSNSGAEVERKANADKQQQGALLRANGRR
jgi:hypothetical protein